MLRRTSLLLALACSALPVVAHADVLALGVEVYGGYNKYDSLGLKSGVDAALSDKALLKNANTHLGLLAALKLGLLEFGALAERGQGGGASTTTVGGLVGPAIDLGDLRLELLGEVGGRRYGDFLKDAKVLSSAPDAEWLAYVGARPGLSMRFGVGVKFMIGIWAFARWDLMSKDVQVTVQPSGGSPSTATYKLGGSTFGASLRAGISL